MWAEQRVGAVIPCFNERGRIGRVVDRVRRAGWADRVLVVDDGSTDGSPEVALGAGAEVLRLPSRQGVGGALESGFRFLEDCPYLVVLAGNDKDEPEEGGRLLAALDAGFDLVQGSRYLPGGGAGGGMPYYRRLATRLHAALFSLRARARVTDSTNGFRALRRSLLEDPRLGWGRPSLDAYGREPFLYLQAHRLNYRVTEVPVTKTYPARGEPYTKMRPFTDWWGILRPLIRGRS